MTAAVRLRCSGRAVDKQRRLTGKQCTRSRLVAAVPSLLLAEIGGVWHVPRPDLDGVAACTPNVLAVPGVDGLTIASDSRCTADPCAIRWAVWRAKLLAGVRAVGWRAVPTAAGPRFTCPKCSPKPVVAPAAAEVRKGSAS